MHGCLRKCVFILHFILLTLLVMFRVEFGVGSTLFINMIQHYPFRGTQWTFNFWTAGIRRCNNKCNKMLPDSYLPPLTGHFTFLKVWNLHEAIRLVCVLMPEMAVFRTLVSGPASHSDLQPFEHCLEWVKLNILHVQRWQSVYLIDH